MCKAPWQPLSDLYMGRPGTSVIAYDPATLLAATTVAGGALSAASTLAGGKAAAQAGQMQKARRRAR